jgi:hypothetical protein
MNAELSKSHLLNFACIFIYLSIEMTKSNSKIKLEKFSWKFSEMKFSEINSKNLVKKI